MQQKRVTFNVEAATEEWQQRLIEEATGLYEKLEAISELFNSPEPNPNMSPGVILLLGEQAGHMEKYLNVLLRRMQIVGLIVPPPKTHLAQGPCDPHLAD